MSWSFEHSVEAKVPPEAAWAFWTEVSNWALDSSLEWVSLDGPFAAGANGVSKMAALARAIERHWHEQRAGGG